MKSMAWSALVLTALLACGDSRAQSAEEILDEAWQAQIDRWDGLDSYMVEQTVMGRDDKQYFVRATATDDDGKERTLFVPNSDIGYKGGCVDTSAATGSGAGDSMASSLSWFFESAELVGDESIDGTRAWQLTATDIDESQSVNGEEITIDAMTMWLSKDNYLHLKMRMEGTAVIEGQSRDVVIESLNSDFRNVPGSKLVEPYRRVMNISGMMADVDPAQLAEAQAQLEQMEQQMAAMPEAQRKMMEKMMGPQLETIRKMAETGGIETEFVVNAITPNPEVKGQRVVACEAG